MLTPPPVVIEAPPEKLRRLRELQLLRAERLTQMRRRDFPTPGDLAKALEPSTVQTPALDLIDSALMDLEAGVNDRLIISVAPQEGKSVRVTTMGPLYFLRRNPDRRCAIVSHGQDLADGFSRTIRNHITDNAGEDGTLDLGLRVAADNGAARRWELDGHRGGVRAVGISGGLTGRPVDALFIDDPVANMQQAQSSVWRDRVWSFWQSVGATRLAPGAPVVVVLTRWHEDDLAGRLLAAEDGHRWRVINIPAVAESPNDPLGREIGEGMISARGDRDWGAIRTTVGEYVWAALYQGRPAPAAGGLFKRTEVQYWTWTDNHRALNLAGRTVPLDRLWKFVTADLATSLKTSADYTAAGVWGVTPDGDLILLDGLRERLEPDQHWPRVNALRTRWDVARVYVEAAMNATTLAYEAGRAGIPISELKPEKDKWTRAQPAAARLNEGRLWVPATSVWPAAAEWVDEWAAFPNAAHDDTVDVLAYAAHVAAKRGQGAGVWSPAGTGVAPAAVLPMPMRRR